MFVNAHGCGIIVPQLLNNQTPVTVELVSNGANKNGRVVLAIPLLENFSWFLGVEFDSPGNFWEVENPPGDWRACAHEGHKRVSRNRQLNSPDPRPDQHPGEEPETSEKAKGAVNAEYLEGGNCPMKKGAGPGAVVQTPAA